MLSIYTGNDTVAVRSAVHAALAPYEAQGIEVLRVEGGAITRELLTARAGGQSLFSGDTAPLVTFLDSPAEDVSALAVVGELAEGLASSPNVFILADRKLLAAEARALKAHATEFHEVKGAPAPERFNVFALADSFTRRDKKSLWVLLSRAREAGLSPEEIIGTLFWQLKTLRLAARTASAEEAGLKPFVYTKAARALSKFKEGELDALSRSLVTLQHEARLGRRDLDLALEQWVLGV